MPVTETEGAVPTVDNVGSITAFVPITVLPEKVGGWEDVPCVPALVGVFGAEEDGEVDCEEFPAD